MSEKLLDQRLDLTEAKISKTNKNRIENVHVAGHVSENGYSYSPQAYKNGITLYEGAPVYFNHFNNDVRDKFAWIEKVVHVEGTGLWGDLVCNEKHPAFEQIMWWAENKPSAIGLSQHVLVKVPDGSTEATEILKVKRVDLVGEPATTKGLFENKHIDNPPTPVKDKDMDLKELDIKTLNEKRPDLVVALTESITKTATEAAVKAEQEFYEAWAKVPETARTDSFKTVFRGATKELRDSLTADLTKLSALPTSHKPVTDPTKKTAEQRTDSTQELSEAELAKTY